MVNVNQVISKFLKMPTLYLNPFKLAKYSGTNVSDILLLKAALTRDSFYKRC